MKEHSNLKWRLDYVSENSKRDLLIKHEGVLHGPVDDIYCLRIDLCVVTIDNVSLVFFFFAKPIVICGIIYNLFFSRKILNFVEKV